MIRWRSKEPAGSSKGLIATAALLIVIFVPLISPSSRELTHGNQCRTGGPLRFLPIWRFHAFSLFVSESVAPWYLVAKRSGGARDPVLRGDDGLVDTASGAAICSCIARLLLLVMALIGIFQAKYLLMIAPWVLLPAASRLKRKSPAGRRSDSRVRFCSSARWAGTEFIAKRFYSAPQFIEPWQEVAGERGQSNQRRRHSDCGSSLIHVLSHLLSPRAPARRTLEI